MASDTKHTSKKTLIWWEKSLAYIHLCVKFSNQNVVSRVCRRKISKRFPCGSFLSCAFDESLSKVLNAQNFPWAWKNFVVARLKTVFLFNDNQVPAARHFQYKVEVFLKEIIVGVPMDKKIFCRRSWISKKSMSIFLSLFFYWKDNYCKTTWF